MRAVNFQQFAQLTFKVNWLINDPLTEIPAFPIFLQGHSTGLTDLQTTKSTLWFVTSETTISNSEKTV